jgi:hypothetical protein
LEDILVERNTIARILVIFGAILQLIYTITNGFFGFILFIIAIIGSIFAPDDPLRTLAGITIATMFISSLIGFIFMIIWFVFASNPGRHKLWLILTGILALIICGLAPAIFAYSLFGTTWPPTWLALIMTSWLPGLLILIGGLIAHKPLDA